MVEAAGVEQLDAIENRQLADFLGFDESAKKLSMCHID